MTRRRPSERSKKPCASIRSYTDALAELVALDMAAGRSAAARRRVPLYLAALPDEPRVLLLHAKLSLTARQLADAERTLRKVAALPNPPAEAYTLLGRLFIAAGKTRLKRRRSFRSWLRNDPQSVAAHMMLGLLLHAQRDVRGAIEHYEKAVALDPRTAAPAANNLAWLYAESGRESRPRHRAGANRSNTSSRRSRAARHARDGST